MLFDVVVRAFCGCRFMLFVFSRDGIDVWCCVVVCCCSLLFVVVC